MAFWAELRLNIGFYYWISQCKVFLWNDRRDWQLGHEQFYFWFDIPPATEMWLKYYTVNMWVRNVPCNLHWQMLLHYCSLERTTRYSDDNKQKTEGPQASLCVKGCCSVFFVFALILFLHSCLLHEAETWRRTASLALSATDKYCVSVLHIYIYS